MTDFPYGLGWLPEIVDVRDYRLDHPEVQPLVAAAPIPSQVDFRAWASPVEDQGQLGSCTANAGVGAIEYLERRAYANKYVNASRLFLYKVTREMAGQTGDTGAYLRDTMRALAMVGVPPEEYWPYRVNQFDKEPTKLAYALATNYKSLKYFRLDVLGGTTASTLTNIRAVLATSVPVIFGFAVYKTIGNVDASGKILYPGPGDKPIGGHAMVMFGYDDTMQIGKETGAFIVRNSWGKTWGDKGYGYLPYRYVLDSLADDFWAIQSQAFVDTGQFA